MTTTYGPYTPVRNVGNLYFVSGQIGVNPDTKTAETDIASQTAQALQNMQRVLHDAGLGMNNVVKTTVFLTSMTLFSAMNEVYEQHFTPPRPARSAVGVRELPRVAGDVTLLVEVEAVACKEPV